MPGLKDIHLFTGRDLQDNPISSLLGKKIKTDELQSKINNYMEKKCEEFCKVNRIAFEVWWSFATYESYNNKWEIRYKGELVCGAKVHCKLKDDNSTEASVSLELY